MGGKIFKAEITVSEEAGRKFSEGCNLIGQGLKEGLSDHGRGLGRGMADLGRYLALGIVSISAAIVITSIIQTSRHGSQSQGDRAIHLKRDTEPFQDNKLKGTPN